MNNKDILKIAAAQSALELSCDVSDLFSEENKVSISKPHPKARKYLTLPFDCQLVTYGTSVVASARDAETAEIAQTYINTYKCEHCFETPNMHVLNDALLKKGLKICFMAEYFLPDLSTLKELPCPFSTAVLGPEDFKNLYTPQWSNALCEKRKELDILGVGSYDGKRLIGLAACSMDCDDMWQIGIDVLPEYRKMGVACSLTSALALKILDKGKVPFYCAAWSNIKSVRNALKSGFRPSWIEMTAKPISFVDSMNKQ